MDHKTEVEAGILKVLDEYDEKALTFLVHFRGKRSHLKFVFPEYNDEACLSMFSVLAKLSHDADVPALFLIPSSFEMVCGLWYADQLLILSPCPELKILQAYKHTFKKLFSGSGGRPLKNLYISCTSPIKESSKVWLGAICIELIEKLEEMYNKIPEKFQEWSELVKRDAKKDYWDFSFYSLAMDVVFENHAINYLSGPREVITYQKIRLILENQKQSLINILRHLDLSRIKRGHHTNLSNRVLSPAAISSDVDFLKDYYFGAFWQIVVHRLLIDQIQQEIGEQRSSRRALFRHGYNPTPINNIAYTQLLNLIRVMSKEGSSDIDQLHSEVLQTQVEDYSFYDPNGSGRKSRFHFGEDDFDSWSDDLESNNKLNAPLSPSKKLSEELAISYAFICRDRWSDIRQRSGAKAFLSGCSGGCCCVEESISDKDPPLLTGQSKLFFLSQEDAQIVAQLGGKLSVKQLPECIDCVQPYSDNLMSLTTNSKSYDNEII